MRFCATRDQLLTTSYLRRVRLKAAIALAVWASMASPHTVADQEIGRKIAPAIALLLSDGCFPDDSNFVVNQVIYGFAKWPDTGRRIPRVVTIDGATTTPDLVVESAEGFHTLVIADGSAGTIFTGNTISMQKNQALIGGGAEVEVLVCESNVKSVFKAPGTRPTINSGLNSAIKPGENASVIGIDLVTTGKSASGFFLYKGVKDVTISDVGIETIGDEATGIEAEGNNQFTIENMTFNSSGEFASGISYSRVNSGLPNYFTISDSTMTTVGNFAHGIKSPDSGVGTFFGDRFTVDSTTIDVSGAFANGIFVNSSGFTVNNSTIRVNSLGGLGADAIDARECHYSVNSSTLFTSGDNASSVHSSGRFAINGGTLTSTGQGSRGVHFHPAFDPIVFQLSGVTVSSPQEGILIEAIPASTISTSVSGTIANSMITTTGSFNEIYAKVGDPNRISLSIYGNTLDGGAGTIRFETSPTIGGTLNITQSAPGSGAEGIDALNNIPAANVIESGNGIDYDQQSPPLP